MLGVSTSMYSWVNVHTSILYMALKYTELPRHETVSIKEFVNALKFCLKCTKSCSLSQEIAGDEEKTKQNRKTQKIKTMVELRIPIQSPGVVCLIVINVERHLLSSHF